MTDAAQHPAQTTPDQPAATPEANPQPLAERVDN
ncbi:Xaa-Pro aminopeptidase, partial [Micrococcus luteus J28]